MTNVIHAHALMDFMQANPQLTTMDEVKIEFKKHFGDVRFTNCTNQIYTFDEIVEFLFQRNKINYGTDAVRVNEHERCQDD